MKNLKKVLALVVALTMVFTTVAFASYPDVDVEADYAGAVELLSALDILKGDENGNFNPDNTITRAEFAAVVCRALGLENSAASAKGATMFKDVAADHWASGYINLAAGQGIVNGYGNGLFGPEDNVTYEQAVKMLVVALGFEPMAAQKGGYPTGYLVVANTYGMTENVVAAGDAAPANRGVVAQLTYNALDIPMMAQTGFGTNVEYKIQDGNNGTKYQTLLTGLKVAKLGGIVEATAVIGGVAAGTMNFLVTDNFDNNAWDEVDKDVTSAGVSNLYNLKLERRIQDKLNAFLDSMEKIEEQFELDKKEIIENIEKARQALEENKKKSPVIYGREIKGTPDIEIADITELSGNVIIDGYLFKKCAIYILK